MIRQVWTPLMAAALMCAVGTTAFAQTSTSSKGSSKAGTKAGAKPSAAQNTKPDAKPAVAATGGAEPSLVGQFGTWGAYVAAPNGKKVCFALAKPSSSKTIPSGRPRDPAYAFVSSRPSEKVTNEVSIMIGYQLKPGVDSSLEIGSAKYAMYAQGDGLWIKNAAEEDRMVDAMRKGADATIKGVSAKGTESVDTFSLKGLAQALDRLAQDCRK